MDYERAMQLEQRLAHLEDELNVARRDIAAARRTGGLARLFGGCAVAACAALTLGTASAAPTAGPLTVKGSFTVVDTAGKMLFDVGRAKDGGGVMTVYDKSGNVVAALQSASGVGGEVVVSGQPGRKARLGTSSDGSQLTLRFFQGDTLLAGMGDTGNGGLLQLNDKAGNKMVKAAKDPNGGAVGIYGTDGKVRALLATTDAGRGALDILNDGGSPAITMKAQADGGYFAVANAAGIARVEASTLPSDQGILRAFGPGGFDYVRGLK